MWGSGQIRRHARTVKHLLFLGLHVGSGPGTAGLILSFGGGTRSTAQPCRKLLRTSGGYDRAHDRFYDRVHDFAHAALRTSLSFGPKTVFLVDVLVINVAHVPDLRCHLIPLPTLIKSGHAFEARPTEIIVRLKSERSIISPLSGTLFGFYGYRVDSRNGSAVLAPGQSPNKSAINIIDCHCAAGHSREVLLPKTTERQGIVIEGELQEQGVLHGEGSSQGHQTVHAHTSR